MSRLVIPDASVVLKWVLPEEGSQEALALRGNPMTAPDLLLVECANALWSRARRGHLTEPEALEALSALAVAPVGLEPCGPFIGLAMRLALELEHPVYDCLYLALAMTRAGRMITADARFYNTASRHALVRDHVALLGQ